jgi:hypothetical protein
MSSKRARSSKQHPEQGVVPGSGLRPPLEWRLRFVERNVTYDGNVMYGRPPLGKDFFGASASGSGAVMYPACMRGAWTAGPEGVRDRAPRSSMRARCAMTFAECSDPVSDRFAVTSSLPLRSGTRLRGPRTQTCVVDAQSIHTLFIGQPCASPVRGRLLVWLTRPTLPRAGAGDSPRQ